MIRQCIACSWSVLCSSSAGSHLLDGKIPEERGCSLNLLPLSLYPGIQGVTKDVCLQLADFLSARLPAHAGIMSLPDVFCLFNRVRGTELVSPDDLLAAVRLFPSIGAPLHLRTFASGLLVVQSSSHSDAEVGDLTRPPVPVCH